MSKMTFAFITFDEAKTRCEKQKAGYPVLPLAPTVLAQLDRAATKLDREKTAAEHKAERSKAAGTKLECEKKGVEWWHEARENPL